MEQTLVKAGLPKLQAQAYLLLIEFGAMSPPKVAQLLKITRSNTYKVLDRLVELELASRADKSKKLVYKAEDPLALNNILGRERNRVLALEHAIKDATQTLRETYQRKQKIDAKLYHGSAALKSLYEQQALPGKPIYFIRSRADIPMLGFETMDYVRRLAASTGSPRFGITQDAPEANANTAIDKEGNLTRTWIRENDYTAPVEISVSGDEVTFFIFEKAGSAIHIQSAAVAEAFRQVWRMLDTHIRHDPEYSKFPYKAQRYI